MLLNISAEFRRISAPGPPSGFGTRAGELKPWTLTSAEANAWRRLGLNMTQTRTGREVAGVCRLAARRDRAESKLEEAKAVFDHFCGVGMLASSSRRT